MHIFDRASKRAKTFRNTTIVMAILGIVLILANLFLFPPKAEEAVAFTSLEENKGKFVQAELVWFGNPFGIRNGDDASAANDVYYLFGQRDDFSLFLVEIGNTTYQKLETIVSSDPELTKLDANPLVIDGHVAKVDSDIVSMAKEEYAKYQMPDRPTLEDGDIELAWMLKEGKAQKPTAWGILFGGILLFASLVTGLVAIISSTTSKKLKKKFLAIHPSEEAIGLVDQNPQVHIPSQKITVYEPFIFGESNTLVMNDLRNVQRAYIYSQYVNNVLQVSLRFDAQTAEDSTMIILKGTVANANQDLMPLWNYLSNNYPGIQLG